jgi:hypothetical protein
MEHLLVLYALPYDARYPVVCFDQRSCFLIGDRVDALGFQTRKVQKEHYRHYTDVNVANAKFKGN